MCVGVCEDVERGRDSNLAKGVEEEEGGQE